MDYQLILYILGIIVVTGGAIWTSKYLRVKGYEMVDIQNSLDISKLILRFVSITLSRKLKDTSKVTYYTNLIIDAIDYLQTLSINTPIEQKIDRVMNIIYKTSDNFDIKLNGEERIIVKEVLLMAYDMYVSLQREKEKHKIRDI